MQKPVLNIDQAEFVDWGKGGRYQAHMARMSPRLGASKLGYNIVRLAPGKAAFPYHFHHVNEELFLVLEGTGRLRQGGQEHPLRHGDLICCPPGEDAAHQIFNDSEADLLYLAISTAQSPEIAEYPDTGKYAAMVYPPPGGTMPLLRVLGYKDKSVDYWEGED